MANIVESDDFSVSITSDSDFITEMFCESCKKDNEYSKAEGFCVDCVEYFCAKCLRFHARFLPHHVQQDQLTMPQDFCLETCELHSSELIKFFCETCSSFACSECKRNLHQNCKTAHVPEIVRNVEKSTNFQLFKSKLNHCEKELKNVTESLIEAKHAEVEKCCNHAKSAIKAQREEINRKFDDLEMDIEISIDKIKTDDTNQLSGVTIKYNELKSKCECLRRNVEIMLSTEQRSKLFITMMKSMNIVEQFEKSITEVDNCSKVRHYVYHPNKLLQTVIEDCYEIGSVTDFGNKKPVKRHRSGEVYNTNKAVLFKSALQSYGKNNKGDLLQGNMDAWKTETINIAVMGCSGVGKSTLINSICEVDADDAFAARVGLTETTTTISPYSLGRNKNVKLWDFPGIETGKFKKEMYLDLIDFKTFDFFVVVVSTRLTETDMWLMQEIEHRDRTFYLLRSHFDCDMQNHRRKKRCQNDDDIKAQKTQMMSTYENVLKEFKSKDIFFIDGMALNNYDYEGFEKTLIADCTRISESKALAIIFALPITTENAKAVKYVQLEKRLSGKALHAALNLPSDESVARSMIEEKKLYISQLSLPYASESEFSLEYASKVSTELLDLEEKLYHKNVHSAVDELFEQCDEVTQFVLPHFDIVHVYTTCRVWLKNCLESLSPLS